MLTLRTAARVASLRRAQQRTLEETRKDLVTVPSHTDVDRATQVRIAYDTLLALKSADNECPHGRCAFDKCPAPNWPHPEPCGCFPVEATTAVPIFTAPERATVLAGRTVRASSVTALSIEEVRFMAAATDPEAPWGRKRNGEPRKRPGRAPRQPSISRQEASSMITFDKLVEQTEAELARVAREESIQDATVVAAQMKLDRLREQRERLEHALTDVRAAAKIEVPA